MRVVRALAAAALLVSVPAGAQSLADPTPTAPLARGETLLVTTGDGEVQVAPDLAAISAGVADLDARTTELSVSPRYSEKRR